MGLEQPSTSRGSKRTAPSLTIRKVSNGFIANAYVNSNMSYLYESKNDGTYYRTEYFEGSSGERIYLSLEAAYKDAETMIADAESELNERISEFKKAMKMK